MSQVPYDYLASIGQVAGPVAPSSPYYSSDQQRRATASSASSRPAASASPAPQAAPQSSTPSVPAGPSQQDLDAAFNPVFQAYDQAEGALNSGKEEDIAGIGRNYTADQTKTNDESAKLNRGVDQNEYDFKNSVQSALAEAVRYYNSIAQKSQLLYGASGAGQAFSDMGAQELYKNQGKIRQGETQGLTSLNNNRNDIRTYISTKLTDLDNWKKDAEDKITQNFRAQLSSLKMGRAGVESDKANARMSLLQDSINQARAIADADRQYRQGLVQYAVQQESGILGRSLTPQEIAGISNSYGLKLDFGQNTPVASTQTANPLGGTNQDQLSSLLNPLGAKS